MGCHRRMQILCESLTGRFLSLLAMNRARKDYRALPLWAAQFLPGLQFSYGVAPSRTFNDWWPPCDAPWTQK